MPATLGHIGFQYLATKACLPKADAKWILAGCVLPDVPWILQRVVVGVTGASSVEVRLYVIAQSSLLVTLILCACLALFSRAPRSVFAVLALGVLLHLGLDALQTKWANGVVLLAPLRWDLVNVGLFWPEDWPTHALYALSAAVGLWIWIKEPRSGEDLQWPRGWRAVAAALLLLAYAGLPVLMTEGARAADLHFAATLDDVEHRAGKPIEFDRSRLDIRPEGAHLQVWTGEEFRLLAPASLRGEVASIRGRFETPTTIRVAEFHLHPSGVRSIASYVALVMIILWWGLCIVDRLRL
ncbi:hypothetical protein Q5Y75_26235 [Ruegeria sp. 2205SS24-7]|uniref:hypothetical protein n=1 Tax=Ruegeria discodermiae TaxID=3064389 RepID=UPI002740C343|nr:hypothetical protein [Ruegeria sp. 2205SS24-7]MDP5220691.1 hypothetical protein [Ruegeria sp. 2205SS24-7]